MEDKVRVDANVPIGVVIENYQKAIEAKYAEATILEQAILAAQDQLTVVKMDLEQYRHTVNTLQYAVNETE